MSPTTLSAPPYLVINHFLIAEKLSEKSIILDLISSVTFLRDELVV